MYLVGAKNQQNRDHLYAADGTIAAGGTAQLLLPERKSTSFLLITNNSPGAIFLEVGGARATATVSGGRITGFNITNPGFGYTAAPKVLLYGGGTGGNTLFGGVGLLGWPSPGDPGFAAPRQGSTTDRIGTARAIIVGGSVSSIEVDDPGSGYVTAPFVLLENSLEPPDPYGVANPFYNSVNSGIQLLSTGSYYNNGTHCTTDAIAIWGATTGQAFTCRWAP